MEDTTTISKQLDTLIDLFKKTGKPSEDNTEKPRQVVTSDTNVFIDGLSDNVKKFLSGLFKFEQPDVKKQVDKKTSFWMDILTLLGGAILGAWSYLKNTVFPYFWKFVKILEEYFTKIGNFFKEGIWEKIKGSKMFTSIETFFKDTLGKFSELFSKEGKIGKLFSFKWLEPIFKPIVTFFEENGVFKAIFTKLKMFSKVFEKLAIFLVPIFALFDFKAGWDDEMKQSGDKAKAVSKGLIAFAINILTLGFINFEDIKKSIDRVMDSFKSGNIFDQFKEVLILIPEAIFKVPVKIISWIVGFFNKDAGKNISDWMKRFSLSELLGNIGTTIGEWVGDYIIAPVMNLWNNLEAIFTKDIPNAFSKFFKSITDFFDKIINFDYSQILKNVPGYETIMKWFHPNKSTESLPERGQPNKSVEAPFERGSLSRGRIAQDYISRPGQPLQHFSSKDTVVGFKEGGPILDQLTSNASFTKKYSELSLKYYSDNMKVLSEIKECLTALSEHMTMQKNSNVMVSNKTNNIVLPNMASSTNFRQNYLGNI